MDFIFIFDYPTWILFLITEVDTLGKWVKYSSSIDLALSRGIAVSN